MQFMHSPEALQKVSWWKGTRGVTIHCVMVHCEKCDDMHNGIVQYQHTINDASNVLALFEHQRFSSEQPRVFKFIESMLVTWSCSFVKCLRHNQKSSALVKWPITWWLWTTMTNMCYTLNSYSYNGLKELLISFLPQSHVDVITAPPKEILVIRVFFCFFNLILELYFLLNAPSGAALELTAFQSMIIPRSETLFSQGIFFNRTYKRINLFLRYSEPVVHFVYNSKLFVAIFSN